MLEEESGISFRISLDNIKLNLGLRFPSHLTPPSRLSDLWALGQLPKHPFCLAISAYDLEQFLYLLPDGFTELL